MRTYAPAATEAVLERLLEEPSLERAVKHHAYLPAREAITAPFPDWLDARIVRGSRVAGSPRSTATRPRRSRRSTPARTSSS